MNTMPLIRLLLVEDDPDWRRGLNAYLAAEPDLEICAEAETSEQALLAFEHHNIDVVLMDIMLASSMDGIWLTAEVTENWNARVIMLTSMQNKDVISSAFQAGALDYVMKEDFAQLPGVIRKVYRDEAPISAKAAEMMRQEFKRLKQIEQAYEKKQIENQITPMELQILKKINEGLTQAQIAEHFVISIRTVKVHVGNILRKLGADSSKEAAALVKHHGLI